LFNFCNKNKLRAESNEDKVNEGKVNEAETGTEEQSESTQEKAVDQEADTILNLDLHMIMKFGRLGLSPPVKKSELGATAQQINEIMEAMELAG